MKGCVLFRGGCISDLGNRFLKILLISHLLGVVWRILEIIL